MNTTTTQTKEAARAELMRLLDAKSKGHATALEVALARRAYEAAKSREDAFQERLDAGRKMVK